MVTTRAPSREPPPTGPWAGRAALAFILLTLVALVLIPIAVQRRVDALRTQLGYSEPARTLVTRLQYNLLREMSSVSELLLGGDSTYAARYADARAAEREIFDELEPLSKHMGPAVVAELAQARALAERWHRGAAEEEILRSAGRTAPENPERARELFEQVLTAIGELDAAVVRAADQARAEIQVAERFGLQLTVLLAVLALLAALAVAALDARVRRVAAVAERRRAEAEEALAETARANEARARLMRGITHDVKNPLGAARGYADLLLMGIKGPVLPEQAGLLEGVRRSVDSALTIITDLLDVARADSGGLTVTPEETPLAAVVRDTAEDHRAEVTAAGHELALDFGDESLTVRTDPHRVRQVLGNLLSNAVKYTPPPGRIVLRVESADGAGPRPGRWARVRVIDSGPGIPPEQREAVFDEFTRLQENGGARGHGLGLAIARRIARLLGGDLTVQDAVPRGADFALWLPRDR